MHNVMDMLVYAAPTKAPCISLSGLTLDVSCISLLGLTLDAHCISLSALTLDVPCISLSGLTIDFFPSPGRTGVAHPFNTGSGWEGMAVSAHSAGSMVGVSQIGGILISFQNKLNFEQIEQILMQREVYE